MAKVYTTRKTGRPTKPYLTSWGEHVSGLRHDMKSGRWFIVGGPSFREPDERRAINLFRQWQSEVNPQHVAVPHGRLTDLQAFQEALEQGGQLTMTQGLDGLHSGRIDHLIPDAALWAYFREQLINRPEWVAERVAIPELARLADLPKPKPSPTLKEVGQLYHAKSTVGKAHRRRVQMFWQDFSAFMAERYIDTLRKVTVEAVAEYLDHVQTLDDSPKYVKHRFTSIRSAVNFGLNRGLHPDDSQHALNALRVLRAPKTREATNPKPIKRDVFNLLLGSAKDSRMQAALQVMLNLVMYPQECLNLDWNEIDLIDRTVVTDRSKTNVVRIGILWERTVEALKKLNPQATGPVFLSREQARWSVKTLGKQFRDLRAKAGVDENITMDMIRDGAYTAAFADTDDLNKVKLLAGHATGISDYYVLRKPSMVADACAAIEAAYFTSQS